jgi:hypothetical protein
VLASLSDVASFGGVVLGLLATLGAVVGVLYGVRYKVSFETEQALANARGEALSDERSRVKALESRLAARNHELIELRNTIARLEALPDLTAIIRVMEQHEVRAQERHEATTAVLSALVARIENIAPLEGGET